MRIKLFEDYTNIPYDEQLSEIELCMDSLLEKWGILEKNSTTLAIARGQLPFWNKKDNKFTGYYSITSYSRSSWDIRIEMPYLNKEKKKEFERDLHMFKVRLSSTFFIDSEGPRKMYSWNIYSGSPTKPVSCPIYLWEFNVKFKG